MDDNKKTELLERVVNSEYDSYIGRCYGILRDQTLAEDALADSIYKIFEKSETFDGFDEKTANAWINRILRNTCIDYLRKNKPAFSLDEFNDGGSFGKSYENSINSKLDVDSAVSNLSEGYADAIFLVDIYGLTEGEAANLAGISPGAFKTRLHRSRQSIKRELGYDYLIK